MLRVVSVLVLLVSFASTARADEWSHTVELQAADAATIRVVEPEGYQLTIDGRTETAPAVFPVANRDAYVLLGVRAPSGATWERKIEVKAWHQSVVRIRHAAARPAAAPPAATYVGVVANTTHLCKAAADRRDLRVEFVSGATIVKTVEAPVRSRVDVELPAGEYRVRRYLRGPSGWELSSAGTFTVDKDGWTYHYSC